MSCDSDIEHEATLNASLRDYTQDRYLSEQQTQDRDKVLKELEAVAKQWVESLLKSKNKEWKVDDCAGSRLEAFGSHLTRTATKDGDIDAVLIVPQYITQQDLFDSLQPQLHDHPHVSQLRAVQGARVPIIKLFFKNIQIDMLLCVVPLPEVPPDLQDIFQMDVLKDMSNESRLSINGLRESLLLPSLVQEPEVLTQAVRAVKLWAKVHGLVHGGLGLLGGFAWTLMVAHVCQKHPHATPAAVLRKFFRIFSQWGWPTPVRLKDASQDELNLKPWDPKVNASDRFHLMPVITPVYPEHNAAFTVTQSGKTLINQALNTANQIAKRIWAGKADWAALYMTNDLFTQYRHYLAVSCEGTDKQALTDWCGLVEARLRVLITMLERQPLIDYLHPHTKPCPAKEGDGVIWLLGLQLCQKEGVTLNLAQDIHTWTKQVFENADTRHFNPANIKIDVKHVKRKQLGQLLDLTG